MRKRKKRRSAVEPQIGHIKSNCRRERPQRKRRRPDQCAAGRDRVGFPQAAGGFFAHLAVLAAIETLWPTFRVAMQCYGTPAIAAQVPLGPPAGRLVHLSETTMCEMATASGADVYRTEIKKARAAEVANQCVGSEGIVEYFDAVAQRFLAAERPCKDRCEIYHVYSRLGDRPRNLQDSNCSPRPRRLQSVRMK